MGRLISSINITVDGCFDHRLAVADDQHHEYATRLLEGAAGLLLGRITYELLRSYWPSVARGQGHRPAVVALARELDEKPKYVVSRDRGISGWNASPLRSEALERNVRALRERLEGDVVVFGSPTLSRALLAAGLVDELHLLLQPFVAGRGPHVFEPLAEPTRLTRTGTTAFDSGVILLRYSLPAGS